jgi:prepilin-type N-terminal cleavage/methylation domain-containing protein
MKGKKGFTLVEMLIVVSLIGVAALLMYSFFGQGFNLYAIESKSADEQADLRQVLSDITNKARLTPPESITYDLGTLNIGSNAYKLESGKITRNGTMIADDISAFNVSIVNGILGIELINTSGKSVSTSVSLLK